MGETCEDCGKPRREGDGFCPDCNKALCEECLHVHHHDFHEPGHQNDPGWQEIDHLFGIEDPNGGLRSPESSLNVS